MQYRFEHLSFGESQNFLFLNPIQHWQKENDYLQGLRGRAAPCQVVLDPRQGMSVHKAQQIDWRTFVQPGVGASQKEWTAESI